jgi:hypothetical protein
MKNTKILMLRFNNYIINIFNNILQKLFTVISINKSPFKGISFSILLLIGIITSLIIRLDYIINLLNQLPYELMFSIRLISALYNILLIFLSMVSIKQSINFYFFYINLNNNNKNKFIFSFYYFYIIYFFLIVLLISYINYYSILSLNINYLNLIYIASLIISFIFGIYYSIYKFNNKEFDLNRTLSLTGKVCLITLIVLYISIFIGLRTGIIFDFMHKLEFIKEIHCEIKGQNINEVNNRIRSGEEDKISTTENTTDNAIIPIDSSRSEDYSNVTPKNSLSLLEKSKDKAMEAVGLFNDPIKRKPSLSSVAIQKLDKLSLGGAENNLSNESIKPLKISLNILQMLNLEDKINNTNLEDLYLLLRKTEGILSYKYLFSEPITKGIEELNKLPFNYKMYDKIIKPNRELMLIDKLNNSILTENILPKKYQIKYPGKLVTKFTKNPIQNEFSFISLFKQLNKNYLITFSLNQLSHKNNPILIDYFSILKVDEFHT